ncbi:MAG TPA: helix-turn-helix domain-containing protein [Gemmataceae bacterium]|nr:helix-turn-helix domain-containing protein [Gemmataceae bacterium]
MLDSAPALILDEAALNRLADLVTGKLAERLRLDKEKMLDINELAERVGLSVRGVRGLMKRHELPEGYEIGGCRRWDWNAVKKFLESNKRKHRKRRGQYDRDDTAHRRACSRMKSAIVAQTPENLEV